MTVSDRYAAFRAELKEYRKRRGLSFVKAGKVAEVSGPWWSAIERGWQVTTGGDRRVANPSRKMVIMMAKAVGWEVNNALEAAEEPPLTEAESKWVRSGPREELARLSQSVSDSQAQALLHVARTMLDPTASVPADLTVDEQTGPGPAELHHHVIETPSEPVRSIDGQEGLIEPS